ncbi:SDR family NAD(P)-dependent oxidoreductase [Pseudohalioglobus lutimaris]|uniref:Short-chain dehydrogenase n=1 Tax=Pseudohalioglobus lutimaris TaxID=1737061 RepID=A0A2N5X4A4_9GAMM|nr:SDR family NAD(P)-dependent oxidoreductase [Pseudohalioglobus lutimaris]PLW69317.1 short-chain dehydrogenase [Pseudohalioglobus lutimaris]
MTTLRETICVKRPIDEAFAYVADFTTTAEWDSTAVEAVQTTPGKPGKGTGFLVSCALPIGSVDLRYTITRFQPPSHIVLRGRGRFFDVEDTITFTEQGDQTQIDYQAEFTFPSAVNPLTGLIKPGLERMGRKSVAGLQAALDDNFPAPDEKDRRSGGPGLTRLAHFTRYGYWRASKSWNPISADLRGKHAVITGTSSGLGYACAHDLARRGAELTLVMRNPTRAREVRKELIEQTGNRKITVEIADLSLLAEVDALAHRLLASGKAVDILINNAGALFNSLEKTGEGIERSVALLLISPYRLTLALKPLLVAAKRGARVINVVSGGMYSQKLSMKNLVATSAEGFSGSAAYARAKRALMIVTRRWAGDWKREGIVVNAMHPGWADTPGVETSLPRFHSLTRFALRSPAEGADTIVWLAAATEAGKVSGELFLDRQPQPLYLMKSTRESDQDRRELFRYLQDYAPEPVEIPTAAAS